MTAEFDRESSTSLIAMESLSPEEALLIRRRFAECKSSGGKTAALVGAVRGKSLEELWPVILERGVSESRLHILKVFDQRFPLSKTTRKNVKNALESQMIWGETPESLWYKRPFYKRRLSEVIEAKKDDFALLRATLDIVLGLQDLKTKGKPHGHLVLENVMHEGDSAILVDPGIRAAINSESSEAKSRQFSAGQSSTFDPYAEDSLALAKVMRQMWSPKQLPPKLREIAAHMEATDPFLRPPLHEVRAAVESLLFQGREKIDLPSPSQTSKKEARLRANSWFLIILILGFLAAGVVFFRDSVSFDFHKPKLSDEAIRLFWESGQPSKMQEVAQAAVQGDDRARALIVGEALQGKERALVRSRLLSLAFNPLWEGDLREEDRRTALGLALDRLVPISIGAIGGLKNRHPAVILAAAAFADAPRIRGLLSQVGLQRLGDLPAPYGIAFRELLRLGLPSMQDLSSSSILALCAIIGGNSEDHTIAQFFALEPGVDAVESEGVFLGKLLALLPLFESNPTIEDPVYRVVLRSGETLSKRLLWFDGESVVDWQSLSKRSKLFLAAGLLPPKPLNLEELADLLKFPAAVVRRESGKLLAEMLPPREKRTVEFLVQGGHSFNRNQIVSLLSAVRLQGEAAYPFIAGWFGSNPDPLSVVELLLARSSQDNLDSFNVEAARYINHFDLKLSFAQLEGLLRHPEPLARASAYARLNPREPNQRALLENALQLEPKENLRALIAAKLK